MRRGEMVSAAVLAAVLVLAWGCEGPPGGSGSSAPAFTTRDSAGIEIAESTGPEWADGEGWTVASEPEVVIRPDETDQDRIFLRIGDIVRMSDGRIVVESTRTRQLFVYGPEGDFLDIWGGLGDGPQEFRELNGTFLCGGDTLIARDVAHFAILDPGGNVVRKVRIPSDLGSLSAIQLRGISRDCGAALITVQQSALAPTGLGSVSYPRLTLWTSLNETRIDTLGMVQGEELFEWEGQPAKFPFHTMPSWASDGSRLYFGVGDEPEVKVLGSGGRVEKLIRWNVDPQPISDGEWRSYGEERERFLEWDPAWTAFTPPPRVHPHPEWQPVYAAEGDQSWYEPGFHFDGEGNLWVRRGRREPLFVRNSQHRAPRPPERWWVFDPSGRWLGEVETPQGVLIKTISGGLVLGVAWDEFDVEEVRGYRIERKDAPDPPRLRPMPSRAHSGIPVPEHPSSGSPPRPAVSRRGSPPTG